MSSLTQNMTKAKCYTHGLFVGSVVTGACHMLVQDAYGLEGYIEHLYGGWLSASITIPIATLALFVCAVYSMVLLRIGDK